MRSCSSDSTSAPLSVGCAFVIPAIPSSGERTDVIVPTPTLPAVPGSEAATGTSTVRPGGIVACCVVRNVTGGVSGSVCSAPTSVPVAISVPAVPVNVTVPTARTAALRVSPTVSACSSRYVPHA